MRAIVCGANGAMGKLICQRLGDEVVAKVSIDGENGVPKTFAEVADIPADVIIDFSHHSAIPSVLFHALHRRCAVVIGTTGHTLAEREAIESAAETIPVFYSGNMSIGIAALCKLAKQAVSMLPNADIEIVEIHHNRKVDAPSGTARMIFDAVQSARPELTAYCGRKGEGRREHDEVGISSLRMGNIVGVHEVHICTENQMLTLRHEALDRGMLADGAVDAARFICGKLPGLYNMNIMLDQMA